MTETRPPYPFRAGLRVRVKRNPGHIGILTGTSETRRSLTWWEVDFPSETDFVSENALEPIVSESSYDRLRGGRYDRVAALRLAMTFYRLSGRLAELIYSLKTTNTELLAYQFKPLLALLESPCQGILVADEVGLGKTIEAGLIWTELRVRANAQRLLVICPAVLREKWRRELADKFGVAADICDANQLLSRLEEMRLGHRDDFAIVASLQGLRAPKEWSEESAPGENPRARLCTFLFENRFEEKLFDLVVIDEAHYLRNSDTQAARFGELIRPVTEWIVLLSATPIQLRNRDLFQLLHLIEPETFNNENSFEWITREAAPVVRLRDQLMRAPMSVEAFLRDIDAALQARSILGINELRTLKRHPPSAEDLQNPRARILLAERLDATNPLTRIINRTRKRDVQASRVLRRPISIAAPMTPQEAQIYATVTERIRDYCVRTDQSPGLMITIPQRQLCSSMPAAYGKWMMSGATDLTDDETWEVLGDSADTGSSNVTSPLVVQMQSLARDPLLYEELRKNDSKWLRLWAALDEYWRAAPDAKVVLFAQFRHTLTYLQERLMEHGVGSVLLMGGMDKDAGLHQFEKDPSARILLSSEVASEGVDLQFCNIVVNYDLPWNPMRIEQRIGRIDRIGQKSESILIWNMMYAGTLDDRVYQRLLSRLSVFNNVLGGTEEILGNPISEMTIDLLSQRLTPEQEEARIEQTRISMEKLGMEQAKLEEESAQLLAHGDWIQAKIDLARDLGRYINGRDIYSYVSDFFATRYAGSRFILKDEATLTVDVDLSAEARIDLYTFFEQQRFPRRSTLSAQNNARTLVRFDNQVGGHSARPEVISQYHPVIRFVTDRLRADEFSRRQTVAACRFAWHLTPTLPRATYVYAVARVAFSGDHDTESLFYAAAKLEQPTRLLPEEDAERLVLQGAIHGEDWTRARHLPGDIVRDITLDCVQEIELRSDAHLDILTQRSLDRVAMQRDLVQRNAQTTERRLTEKIEEMRNSKNRALRLFEGQLAKHRAKTEWLLARLEKRKEPVTERRFVAYGVIEVY